MKIMLDPGHGAGESFNRGFVNIPGFDYCNEGDCNFYYATQFLKPALEKYGIEVGLTRHKITDNPSLAARGRMAKGYDLFISLHSNGIKRHNATGTEIWDSTNPKESTKSLTDKLSLNISKAIGTNNRGTKYRKNSSGSNYYGVLRNGLAKHNFIIEHAFHDNYQDCYKYVNSLQKIAEVTSKTIAEYYNLVDKKDNEEEKGMVKIDFEGKQLEVEGKLVDNKNYVSIRDLFEKLGYEVDWKDNKVIISKEKFEETKYYEIDGLKIIETTADKISIERVNNKTLSELDETGISGTFYRINEKEIYGIAVQDDEPLETNSYVSNFDGKKRGTIWYDGQKMHIAKIYNAKTEIKGHIKWAISGLELYPNYNPTLEGFSGPYADVLRRCNHTAIGFNGDKVYLIVAENLYLKEFRERILNSSIAFAGLIALDGGGSTQMSFKGKDIIRSSRKLNHIISVRE